MILNIHIQYILLHSIYIVLSLETITIIIWVWMMWPTNEKSWWVNHCNNNISSWTCNHTFIYIIQYYHYNNNPNTINYLTMIHSKSHITKSTIVSHIYQQINTSNRFHQSIHINVPLYLSKKTIFSHTFTSPKTKQKKCKKKKRSTGIELAAYNTMQFPSGHPPEY